jgi:hypothetical protein
MERFIAQQNVARYKELLKTETDPTKRTLLQGLLTEEEVKLASREARP